MKEHDWHFLIPGTINIGPYPMSVCWRCGKFASAYPGEGWRFNTFCDGVSLDPISQK